MNPYGSVRRGDRHDRGRGSILVLALLVSASAAALGMWMVVSSDLKVRKGRYLGRAAEARRVAMSGVEIARQRLGGQANFSGTTATSPEHPSHTLVVSVTPTGWREALVQASGAIDDSTSTVFSQLRAVPHASLAYNAISGGTLSFTGATVGGRLRANGRVRVTDDLDFLGTIETKVGAQVDGDVPAEQVIYDPATQSPASPSLAVYAAQSAALLSVPKDGNDWVIELAYLSPTSNPYGGTNADGLYVFDAGNQNVFLRDVYIRGTLTILNAKNVTVERGYYHERARSHLATLLVDGDLDLRLELPIGETDLGIDLNGSGQIRQTETAGPGMNGGILYVTGKFSGPGGGFIRGAILAGQIDIIGSADLQVDPDLDEHPIQEFTESGAWEIVPGTISG